MADVGLQLQYFHIYTREFASDKYMNNVLYNSYKDILWFWRDAAKVLNQRGIATPVLVGSKCSALSHVCVFLPYPLPHLQMRLRKD